MGRTIRRTALAATLAALALAPAVGLPPAAHAAAYEDVFADFQSDGRIDACRHSEDVLRKAKADIPNDIEDYARTFPRKLDAAIEQRSSGACDADEEADPAGATGSGGAAAPPAPEPTATAPVAPPAPEGAGTPQPPGASAPAPPASDGAIGGVAAEPADEGGDIPAVLLALAILAALLAVVLLVWALARMVAWEPRWLPGARHAIAEAGWRTGGAWSDFSDWIRSRRTA